MDEEKYLHKDIKIESFWGAIANIALFQIFGFIVFQAFVAYLNNLFMMFWGGIWLIVLLFFQSKMLAEIRQFLSKKSARSATLSLRQLDDWVKFILTIVFILILVSFSLGYYPFPKADFDVIKLVLFYIFSIVTSSVFSSLFKSALPKSGKMKYSGSPLGGFFGGLFFVLFGYFIENFTDEEFINFYLPGMPGIGFMVICLSILLLEDQIKK